MKNIEKYYLQRKQILNIIHSPIELEFGIFSIKLSNKTIEYFIYEPEKVPGCDTLRVYGGKGNQLLTINKIKIKKKLVSRQCWIDYIF